MVKLGNSFFFTEDKHTRIHDIEGEMLLIDYYSNFNSSNLSCDLKSIQEGDLNLPRHCAF